MKAMIALVCMVFSACGGLGISSNSATPIKGDLDRAGAARLIAVYLTKQEPQKITIGESFVCGQQLAVNVLEKLGYLHSIVINPGSCKYELAEKGRAEVQAGRWIQTPSVFRDLNLPGDLTIPISKIELVEVTGIKGGSTSQAQVEFTCRLVPNDLSRQFDNSVLPEFGIRPAPFPRSVTFEKYDDGWRVR